MDDEVIEMRDQGELDFTNDDDYADASFGVDTINIDSDQTIPKSTEVSLKQEILKVAVDAYYDKLYDKFWYNYSRNKVHQ